MPLPCLNPHNDSPKLSGCSSNSSVQFKALWLSQISALNSSLPTNSGGCKCPIKICCSYVLAAREIPLSFTSCMGCSFESLLSSGVPAFLQFLPLVFILSTTWLPPLTSGALAFSFSFSPKYCLYNQPFRSIAHCGPGVRNIIALTSEPGSPDTTPSPSLSQHPVSTCLEEGIRLPVNSSIPLLHLCAAQVPKQTMRFHIFVPSHKLFPLPGTHFGLLPPLTYTPHCPA